MILALCDTAATELMAFEQKWMMASMMMAGLDKVQASSRQGPGLRAEAEELGACGNRNTIHGIPNVPSPHAQPSSHAQPTCPHVTGLEAAYPPSSTRVHPGCLPSAWQPLGPGGHRGRRPGTAAAL